MQHHSNLAKTCIEMHKECNSNWEILEYVTSEGIEYPDAVYLVTRALRLDDEEVFEMEDRYTMNNHQYTYTPAPQESKIEGIIITVACVAVFAFIGVLLAWRG